MRISYIYTNTLDLNIIRIFMYTSQFFFFHYIIIIIIATKKEEKLKKQL